MRCITASDGIRGERIYDGRVFRLAAHSARLINSARLLDYEIPWTRAEIEESDPRRGEGEWPASGYIRADRLASARRSWAFSGRRQSVHPPSAPWAAEAGCRGWRATRHLTSPWRNIAAHRPISRGPTPSGGPLHRCGIGEGRALKPDSTMR